MGIIGVSGPHEIVYIGRFKMPGQFVAFGGFRGLSFGQVTMPNFFWVLQIAGAANHVLFVDADFYIKITPNAVKFSGDVGVRMPSLIIVFAHFGVPLRHGIIHSLGIVAPRTANLKGHLSIKIHLKNHATFGQNGLVQGYLQDGSFGLVLQGYTVFGQFVDFQVANFVGFEFADTCAYPRIGIGKGL